jgi:predicted DNA-binding transcriptional regulator AlpA
VTDSSTAAVLDDIVARLTEIRDLFAASARPPPELLTREDVAAVLSVGVSTLDRLRAQGRIGPQAVELSGVKFIAAEVRAWVAHRDHAGGLYDANSWPAVWRQLQKSPKPR